MNKINYLFINIILLIFLINFQNAMFAADNGYSNNLLKLNIEKEKNNDNIDVTLFTSKPSDVKLTPIKRSENEYMIFLPETYHSITAKPDISSLTEIQDVDVKLIPYIDSQTNNGYTKITIKTKKDGIKLNIKNQVFKQEDFSDLSQLAVANTEKKAEKTAKLARKTEIKEIKTLTKSGNTPTSNISETNIKPEKTAAIENNTALSLNKKEIPQPKIQTQSIIVGKKSASKADKKEAFPYFQIIIALAAFAAIRLAITFATFNRQKVLIAKKREEDQASTNNTENTLSGSAHKISELLSRKSSEAQNYDMPKIQENNQSENLDYSDFTEIEKYSSIIENIVRKNPKFSENEDLIDDFRNEIIKRSHNLLVSMDNSQNPEMYLNRIARPAMIQVLKDNNRLKSLI